MSALGQTDKNCGHQISSAMPQIADELSGFTIDNPCSKNAIDAWTLLQICTQNHASLATKPEAFCKQGER